MVNQKFYKWVKLKNQDLKKMLLIKIHYTTVHIGDTKIRRLEPRMRDINIFFIKQIMGMIIGFNKPKKSILGMESIIQN